MQQQFAAPRQRPIAGLEQARVLRGQRRRKLGRMLLHPLQHRRHAGAHAQECGSLQGLPGWCLLIGQLREHLAQGASLWTPMQSR